MKADEGGHFDGAASESITFGGGKIIWRKERVGWERFICLHRLPSGTDMQSLLSSSSEARIFEKAFFSPSSWSLSSFYPWCLFLSVQTMWRDSRSPSSSPRLTPEMRCTCCRETAPTWGQSTSDGRNRLQFYERAVVVKRTLCWPHKVYVLENGSEWQRQEKKLWNMMAIIFSSFRSCSDDRHPIMILGAVKERKKGSS